jgi:hypothetical protein
MLTDYAHEEITLIAKRKHLDEFIAEVDRLRDASARLNKRIDFLTQRLKSDSAL